MMQVQKFYQIFAWLILCAGLFAAISQIQAQAIIPTSIRPCNCKVDTCTHFGSNKEPPVSVVGTLSILKTLDANSRPYSPYILKLNQRLCIAADTSIPDAPEAHNVGPLKQIQLTFDDTPANQAYLQQNLGQNLTASGRLFAAFTGWHVTPAVLNTIRLQKAN